MKAKRHMTCGLAVRFWFSESEEDFDSFHSELKMNPLFPHAGSHKRLHQA